VPGPHSSVPIANCPLLHSPEALQAWVGPHAPTEPLSQGEGRSNRPYSPLVLAIKFAISLLQLDFPAPTGDGF
jgi:hypothetical protein